MCAPSFRTARKNTSCCCRSSPKASSGASARFTSLIPRSAATTCIGWIAQVFPSTLPGDRQQLEVRDWQEVYLRGGQFLQHDMLALVDEVLGGPAAAAFPQTRVVAHMEWALGDFPGVDDLVEYETRLNHVLPRYPGPVVCVYDSARFGAGLALDVLRTHPMVILGGVLQVNPFFVPPDEFLRELRERKERVVPT